MATPSYLASLQKTDKWAGSKKSYCKQLPPQRRKKNSFSFESQKISKFALVCIYVFITVTKILFVCFI